MLDLQSRQHIQWKIQNYFHGIISSEIYIHTYVHKYICIYIHIYMFVHINIFLYNILFEWMFVFIIQKLCFLSFTTFSINFSIFKNWCLFRHGWMLYAVEKKAVKIYFGSPRKKKPLINHNFFGGFLFHRHSHRTRTTNGVSGSSASCFRLEVLSQTHY